MSSEKVHQAVEADMIEQDGEEPKPWSMRDTVVPLLVAVLSYSAYLAQRCPSFDTRLSILQAFSPCACL